MAYFRFNGFPPEKQNVSGPDDDACMAGVGRWRKGEIKDIVPDLSEWLREGKRVKGTDVYWIFTEMDGPDTDTAQPFIPPAPPKPERSRRSR